MRRVTCTKCNGSGRYDAPSSHGPHCFACKGTGLVVYRKPRAAEPRQLPSTRRIADICAGDPTKLALDNHRALAYLGITEEQLLHYRELWVAGVREVAR